MIYLTFCSVLQYLRTSKDWAVLEHGITMLSSLSLFLGILATEHLFDLITETGKGGTSHSQVGIALAIVTVITISQQVLRGTDKYVRGYVSYRNVGLFMSELMLKLSRLPAKHFQNPSFLDSIDRTKRCIEYESLGYFSSDCLRFYTYYGVFLISISFYFFRLSPLLPLIIFLSFIPANLGQLAQVKVFTRLKGFRNFKQMYFVHCLE